MDRAAREIRWGLQRGEDRLTITSQQELLDTLANTTGILVAFLAAIAGISLLVGGI